MVPSDQDLDYAPNNVDNFTLVLRSTRLVEVEKPWFPQIKILIMHLIVKFQSVINDISPQRDRASSSPL